MAIASPGPSVERSVSHDARILVVDDESDIANLLGTVLREEGFSVGVVTESRQALEIFNSFRPDLVSLDVMMPSVDGISLCLQLRKESDVPILFVSAKSDPPDRVVGLRIGADDYMGKPFDNNELFARDDLLTGVWGYEPGSDTRLVDVHVGRLRKKLLDRGVTEVSIETARGFGYKLSATQQGQQPE